MSIQAPATQAAKGYKGSPKPQVKARYVCKTGQGQHIIALPGRQLPAAAGKGLSDEGFFPEQIITVSREFGELLVIIDRRTRKGETEKAKIKAKSE